VAYPLVEADIEAFLVEMVRQLGGKIRKVRWVGRRGAPDRFVWIPGWAFPAMVELKKPGETPRINQLKEIDALRSMNVRVEVVDSMEGVRLLLCR
jgi:hypothetical protein